LKEKGLDFFPISGATGEGIQNLLDAVFQKLALLPKSQPILPETPLPQEAPAVEVFRDGDAFVVKGKEIERAVAMTDLENDEAIAHLQKIFARYHVESLLKKAGIQEGDWVRIGGIEFLFSDTRPPRRFKSKSRSKK